MKKQHQNFITGLILIASIFLIQYSLSSESTDSLKGSISDNFVSILNDSFSGVEETHFTHLPITYSLDLDRRGDDYSEQENSIREAFQIIEDQTDQVVYFKEVSSSKADIKIHGYISSKGDGEYFVEGEAGVVDNITNQAISSEVNFYSSTVHWYNQATGETGIAHNYRYYKCPDFPLVETHEILHALGFGHVGTNSNQVMLPFDNKYQSCAITRIDNGTINCLKYIYSNGSFSGNCSELSIYPHSPYNDNPAIEDFKWQHLPIMYNIINCSADEFRAISNGVMKIEELSKRNILTQVDTNSQIEIVCKNNFDGVILSKETDFNRRTGYPMGLTEYYFDGHDQIEKVRINLWLTSDKSCGNGYEFMQLLHSIGLRKSQGTWFEIETELCSPIFIADVDSLQRINDYYS